MKSFKIAGIALLASMITIVAATQADDKEEKVLTVKCPVAGKEIKIADAKTASYKDAEVYLCCNGCKGKLEKDPAKYSTKANHQLILTKQAKQVKCPLAGKPVNPAQHVKVAGIQVGFCCGNCKGKVAKAEGDDQLALVFSDAAFKKGFEVVKKEE
ncbi:MAG: hypothetical protein RIK87_07870 [Fuerstiella sp.]